MSRIFISYSHQDEAWKKRVSQHLGVLARQGLLEVWDDRRIQAGDDWLPAIEAALADCQVALLLVSAAFLDSDFILKSEIPALLERRAKQGLRVIPVIVKPCAWDEIPWLAGIQARPKDGNPLTSFNENDAEQALTHLAKEILRLCPASANPSNIGCAEARGASLANNAPPNVGTSYNPSRRSPGGMGCAEAPGAPLANDAPPDVGTSYNLPRISTPRLRHGAAHLFGREGELQQLDAALGNPASRIVSVVAWGGTGKTSLAVEWLNRLAAQDWPGLRRVFDWSFYSQGSREASAASSDAFLAAALQFFGDADMTNSPASAWDKGARLAALIAQEPTLLLLDGLEPLQHPPGPLAGQLKDPALQALLKALARSNPGLCLITTRESIADLAPYRETAAPELPLQSLPEHAGVALLRSLGVKGADSEYRQLVKDVGGHALTLNLLGNYLAQAHHGDIRRRDRVKLDKADAKIQGGHAFKAMAAYDAWLEQGGESGRRQRALLRLLGLFDRPADAGCLAALRAPPAIAGLTEELQDVEEDEWNLAVSGLRGCGLLLGEHLPGNAAFRPPLPAGEGWGEGSPNATAFKFPHPVPLPEGEGTYNAARLHQPSNGSSQAWLLNHAAFHLRALGRLREALEPMEAGLEMRVAQEVWKSAAIIAGNLSELRLLLGDVAAARQAAQRALDYAGRSDDAFERMVNRIALADALQQAGQVGEAEALFRQAEAMQQEDDPRYPLLYSLRGFQYCELLLAPAERAAWRAVGLRLTPNPAYAAASEQEAILAACRAVSQRAEQTLQIAEKHLGLLDIALDQLSLSRATLYAALLGENPAEALPSAQRHGDAAVRGLRQAGRHDHLPRGLLNRAWLRAVQERWEEAEQDLDEAQDIAERGPMPLHLADVHLHRARIFRDKAELARAAALIAQHGYARRAEELADAQR